MSEWYVKSQHYKTLVYTLSKYAVNLDPVWLCMNCKQEVDTITVLFTQTPSELQSSPDIHHLWHYGQFSKAIMWTQSSSCPLCVHQVQVHGDVRISSTVYKHTVNVFHAVFTRVKTDACSIHAPYCQNKLYEKNFSKASDERWKTTFCVILLAGFPLFYPVKFPDFSLTFPWFPKSFPWFFLSFHQDILVKKKN